MFNPAAFETYVIDGDGLVLDQIIFRRYRRPTPGLVEATFDINPGLSFLGPFIPHGTVIKIPIDTPATPQQVALRKLW